MSVMMTPRQQCAYAIGNFIVETGLCAGFGALGAITFTTLSAGTGAVFGAIFGTIYNIANQILSAAFQLDPNKCNIPTFVISTLIATAATYGIMHLIGIPLTIGSIALLAVASLVAAFVGGSLIGCLCASCIAALGRSQQQSYSYMG